MKRTILQDPFFTKQPENKFVEDLKKSIHLNKPEYYGKREIKNNETDAHGIYIAELYPDDPKGLLTTVYDDFKRFSEVYEISGDRFPVYLKKKPTPCFEAYTVEVNKDCVNIYSDDTEGIRRGVIYLQDELRRQENAFLKIGTVDKKPVIHSRITRCFFSPINRAPRFIDELNNDIDYYPEEYLNKLMHDGSNGIWIYTRFSDLMPSDYLAENGVGYEKRIAKLNRVVQKCAKYGIGVYVFAIEPYWITAEQAKKTPQLAGHRFYAPNAAHNGNATLCTNSEMGKAYCYEQGTRLLELVPDLAGVISITTGERPTSCACVYKECNCEICSKKKPGVVLSDTVEALRSGIRDSNPKCKVISWTYGHRDWEQEDIDDYIESAPDDAFLMENFEDMGYEKQLGKMRQCVDYWLSYPGPSQFFEAAAKKAKEAKKHLFAKMQICCSHELASVPYIPAPGLVFDKYKGAYELGVEGVMQCWYFGNYPSLMSKAAGELAFMEDFSDKDAFLKRLAGIYWGNTNAEKICSAWKEFEESYVNYPMNIMFSYYGPMHDGVVWDLSLKPRNFSLPRTWLTVDPTDGDRIGECLLNGHTLDEACTLLEEMQKHWQKGMEILNEIDICNEDEKEQISVGTALGILISSGKNILEFYKLRDELGYGKGDALTILEKMRKIVVSEISNSSKMLQLCNNDTRLGYHSEGEAYKFFPEKLENRVSLLEKLLQTEFVEVEDRIKNGLIPLEYYTGVEDNDSVKTYKMTNGKIEESLWENIDSTRKFRVAYDKEYLHFEFYSDNRELVRISPEYRLFFPDADIEVTEDFKVQLAVDHKFYYSLFGERVQEELKKYSDITVYNDAQMHFCLKVKLSDVGIKRIAPMKMRIDMGGKLWCEDAYKVITLGKTYVNPGDYGWLIP